MMTSLLAETALFPAQASTTAARVDALFWFLFVVCGAVGLLVATLLIGFSIRYRRRAGDGRPAFVRPWYALEWFWTITPIGFFAVMFVWGAEVYLDAFRPPADATRIYSIGRQWMWKFQHPEGQREINTLHVPTGQPVQILFTSEDVIHSFFVPEFRVHMDVLPNRYTSVWFAATRVGEYHLFCSQYCGTDHAGMVGRVIVMRPADYEKWLTAGAEGSLALEGRKVFLKYRCVNCHSATTNAVGPVLEGLFERPARLSDGTVVPVDENYIRESILHPGKKIVAGWQNLMPTFQGQIREDEIYALIAYFRTLRPGGTPTRVENDVVPERPPEATSDSSPVQP